MQQGHNEIVIKQITQNDQHVEISQRQIPFDNHEQESQETEEEIGYRVVLSKLKKQRKTACKQKYSKRILLLVVTIIIFIALLFTLSLSSLPQSYINTIFSPVTPQQLINTQQDVNLSPITNNQIPTSPLNNQPKPIVKDQSSKTNDSSSPQIQDNLQKMPVVLQPVQSSPSNVDVSSSPQIQDNLQKMPVVLQPIQSSPSNDQTTTIQTQKNVFNIAGPKQLKQVYIPIQNPQVQQNFHLHPITRQHDHEKTTLNYSSMGIPQIGKTFNFTPVKFQDMYHYESIMDEVFKPYNDTNCNLQRYGDYADGGYLLCKNLMNLSVALINLGVQGRDYFGCQLTSTFPMANYQYDCTNGFHPNCPTNNNSNFFSSSCLGERTQKSQNTQFYSLKDIVDSRNLTKKRVTMKIDIEGGQWPGFRTFPIEYLDYVDQFILEIHNPGRGIQQGALWGNADIIRSLGQKFVSVNLHMNNNACIDRNILDSKNRKIASFAIEVTMVNKGLIKLNSNSRSYALNVRNHPNAPFSDCQMLD